MYLYTYFIKSLVSVFVAQIVNPAEMENSTLPANESIINPDLFYTITFNHWACLWSSPYHPHEHCNETFNSPTALYDHVVNEHVLEIHYAQLYTCMLREHGEAAPCRYRTGGQQGHEGTALRYMERHVMEHVFEPFVGSDVWKGALGLD